MKSNQLSSFMLCFDVFIRSCFCFGVCPDDFDTGSCDVVDYL